MYKTYSWHVYPTQTSIKNPYRGSKCWLDGLFKDLETNKIQYTEGEIRAMNFDQDFSYEAHLVQTHDEKLYVHHIDY